MPPRLNLAHYLSARAGKAADGHPYVNPCLWGGPQSLIMGAAAKGLASTCDIRIDAVEALAYLLAAVIASGQVADLAAHFAAVAAEVRAARRLLPVTPDTATATKAARTSPFAGLAPVVPAAVKASKPRTITARTKSAPAPAGLGITPNAARS